MKEKRIIEQCHICDDNDDLDPLTLCEDCMNLVKVLIDCRKKISRASKEINKMAKIKP